MQDTFLYTVISNFVKELEYATFQVVYRLAKRENMQPPTVRINCALCIL